MVEWIEYSRKWSRLLALLRKRPREFRDRVEGRIEVRLEELFKERIFGSPPQYETVAWADALQDIEAYFGYPAADILSEVALAEIEEHVQNVANTIRKEDAGDPDWGADTMLARCHYLMCRLCKPSTVVETGVSFGVSSAFILKALEENGQGVLHSIDIPHLSPIFAERFWGIAVPEELKSKWNLYRGSSRQFLPKVLEETGPIDIFVHDSLHTYRNMVWEFNTAWPYLRRGGVIIADDIKRNRAFNELQQRDLAFWRAIRDVDEQLLFTATGNVMFGVAVK